MRVPLLALLTAAVLTSPITAAAWQLETQTDPLTDAKHTFATVTASTTGADLVVQCLNGNVTPLLRFDRPIGVHRIGAAYRFDSAATVSRFLPLAADGRTAWPWLGNEREGLAALRAAKRLRVQIFPHQRAPTFYEFDVTGAGDAVKQVRCR